MIGQWIGRYNGSNNQGHITLNIEVISKQHHGIAILVDYSKGPSFTVGVNFENNTEQNLQANLFCFTPINPKTFLPDTWENISNLFPRFAIPKSGTFSGLLTSNNSMTGQWNTDVGTRGKFEVFLSEANKPTRYKPNIMTWKEFKSYVTALEKNLYVFRGQPKNWKLRTSYHRTGRCNLYRYELQNIPELHRHVCAQSGKLFDLSNALEYGALLNLAQHHGYPTPLLDWTLSPYIATYFAFSGLSDSPQSEA